MPSARSLVILFAAVVLGGCWTVPGAGPTRSGHNPLEPALTTDNVASLAPEWTWQAEWSTARAVLDPIVSAFGVHISVGHKLVTVSPATGAERWRAVLFDVALAEQIPVSAGAPTFDGGRVLVPVGVYRNLGPGAGAHSYDAQSGADLGTVARSSAELTLPSEGRLVGTYGDVIGSGIGVTGYFVVDQDDPSKSWGAHLSVGGFDGSVLSSPAASGTGFVISSGGQVLAYPLTEPAGCYNPIPGSPYRFCPPIWSRSFGGGLTRPTVTRDGEMLFVGDAGHLWALQASTGGHLWSGPLPTSDPPSAPVSVDDAAALVVTAGRVVAFDRNGCGAAACGSSWSADTGGVVNVQPAIAGGVVYTATTGGVVRAFAAAGCGASTCAPLWEHDLGVAVTGAPAVSNGRLLVGTVDGRLVAFTPRADART